MTLSWTLMSVVDSDTHKPADVLRMVKGVLNSPFSCGKEEMWLSLFFFQSVNESGDKVFGPFKLFFISEFWKGQHLNQVGWVDANKKIKQWFGFLK